MLPSSKKSKDQSVETLRGLAIALLVAFHASGEAINVRSVSAADGLLSQLAFSLEPLRMPLFTVISGFVYAMRPLRPGCLGKFLQGKARRILLPFFTVATLQYVLKAVGPGVNARENLAELWTVYAYGYAQFWFLQAIFLVFLLIAVAENFKLASRFDRWLWCLAASVLLSLYLPDLPYFSFSGARYLLPYFVLGLGLNRFSDQIFNRKNTTAAFLFLAVGVAAQQLAWFEKISISTERISALALILGCAGNYLLFRFKQEVPGLATLGSYAYSIYLFHFFGFALATRFGAPIGVAANSPQLVVLSLAFGLALPIIFEHLCTGMPVARTAFLGLRT